MKSLSDTESLSQLVRKKHAVLSQIHELVQRQRELVAERDVTRMMGLLASKQKLLVELQAIEGELEPFREQDPDSRDWPTSDARVQCQQVASDADRLLEEIKEVERWCERQLVEQQDRLSTQIDDAQAAHQANTAYRQQGPRRPQQLDLTSDA